MTLKKPAKLIAIAGACAVAVALPARLLRCPKDAFGPEADSDPGCCVRSRVVAPEPEL